MNTHEFVICLHGHYLRLPGSKDYCQDLEKEFLSMIDSDLCIIKFYRYTISKNMWVCCYVIDAEFSPGKLQEDVLKIVKGQAKEGDDWKCES